MQILRLDSAHPDAFFLLGMIALESRNVGKAVELIERALVLAPVRRRVYEAQLARCLVLLGRVGEAVERAEHALEGLGEDPRTLDVLGVVFSHAGAHDLAASLFQRAAAAAPQDAGIHYNLASSLQFLGRFEPAEAAFERVIELEPAHVRAHAALSQIRTQTADRNHVARLRSVVENLPEDVDGELILRHALAKEYEDLGDYAAAFREFGLGKAKKRQSLSYSIDQDRALFEQLTAAFTPERVRGWTGGHDSAEPIFVVGMPRSGTTLVDRMLSSHSAVTSAGELQNFGVCLKRMAATDSARVLDVATLQSGLDVDFELLGRSYVESTRPGTGDAEYFVDKLPLNFFYIGFIALALPKAKIVCLRRDPMDTCLSNYRQLFAVNFPYYFYSLQLEDIASYYAMFVQLIDHWDRLFPGRIHQLRYERLVAAPEPELRRLLSHCGLSYEPACLEFYRNPAAVATASAMQVREPLSSRSIGRWRRYGDVLDRLRRALESLNVPLVD